jgi:hypothetical protein
MYALGNRLVAVSRPEYEARYLELTQSWFELSPMTFDIRASQKIYPIVPQLQLSVSVQYAVLPLCTAFLLCRSPKQNSKL